MRNIFNFFRDKLRLYPGSKSVLLIPVSALLVLVTLFSLPNASTDDNSVDLPQQVIEAQQTEDTEIVQETDKSDKTESAGLSESPSVIGSTADSNTATGSVLEVHFIDVGQADASLIRCDGKSMLIDGGNSADSNLIYTYLKKHGVDHLDYIINTHPHEDHVGGLAGALNYASVGTAMGSITEYDSRAFSNFVSYLEKQNRSITVPKAGDTFSLGSADVVILGPIRNDENMNNNSIVLKITFGKTSFLFTGDAEREEEQDILEMEYDLKSTVLKVGHHGSETSSSYPFLREIMPEYAVISVGKKNSYGHPHESVLSRLRDADAKVLRTDMQGDIVFTSDGETVSYTVTRNADVDTLGTLSETTPISQAKPESTPTPTTTPTPSPKEDQNEDKTEISFVLNTNTKKFHLPHCASLKRMSEKNRKETGLTRDEIISQGYSPCGNCKP